MTKRNVDIHITGRERTEKAFRKARQDFKSLGSELGRLTKRAAAFSAVAAGAAVAGLSLVVKHNLEAIDATGKLSDRLKVSTEDLLAWRHAAELAGVSGQNLDKAVEEMNKRLGEVRETGTGEALKGMDMLGLSMQDIRDFGPAELFETIADRIAAIEDPAKRSAAAYAFFGRQGKQLINLLAGGSSGLRQARAELESMGALYSREEARRVEAANDAMTRLQTTFAGLAQTLTIELAPTLEAVAQTLQDMVAENSDIGGVLSRGFDAAADSVIYLLALVESARYGLLELRIAAEVARTAGARAAGAGVHPVKQFNKDNPAVLNKGGMIGLETGDVVANNVAEAELNRLRKKRDEILTGRGLDERLKTILDTIRGRNGGAAGRSGWTPFSGTNEAIDASLNMAEAASKRFAELERQATEAARKRHDGLQQWAESVRDALKTPADQLDELKGKLAEVVGTGQLGAAEAARFFMQRQSALRPQQRAEPIVAPSTFSARSARGLTDVPGGQNPMVLAARAAEKNAETARDQLAVQENIRRELVRLAREQAQPANLN